MRGESSLLAAQEYRMRSRSRRSTAKRFTGTTCLARDGRRWAYRFALPGTAALGEQVRRVVANFVPKLESWRLTMTLPLLNQSRQVLFLVSGDKDPKLLERVLAGDAEFPASRVNPPNGRLSWMIGAHP
jgi:6-phosphogluconolactonase